MRVRKAVLTVAAPYQRGLPLQTLIDADGIEKPLLRILLEEIWAAAAIEEVALVIHPGDETAYQRAAGGAGRGIRFIPQDQPRGYGHAIHCAAGFVGTDPFLHLVGDHVYVSRHEPSCAKQLVTVAEAEQCAVSAVVPTRESHLSRFGAIGGQRLAGRPTLYRVDTVLEKPTPTQAEQRLTVSGLRAGYYLCYFGMHVLTPAIVEILGQQLQKQNNTPVTLSSALAELAAREQYLALEASSYRYNVGARYGLLAAQTALALYGKDREYVLTQLLELLAQRQLDTASEQSN